MWLLGPILMVPVQTDVRENASPHDGRWRDDARVATQGAANAATLLSFYGVHKPAEVAGGIQNVESSDGWWW